MNTIRYRVVVEYGYPDVNPPQQVFRELAEIAYDSGGTVVSMERVDPVWCADCEKHHEGTGAIVRTDS